jgi:hypothetical protein
MKTAAALAILSLAGMSFAPQDPPAKDPGPAARQEAFLAGLKAGEAEKAYEKLFKGTRFADEVEKMTGETEKGISVYGEIASLENLGLVRQDKYQALGMASLCCDKGPLNFYFTWYRKSEAAPWILTSFWFNDQAKEYFQFRK